MTWAGLLRAVRNPSLFFFGLGAGLAWALHSILDSGFVKGKMSVFIWGGDEAQAVSQVWRGCK